MAEMEPVLVLSSPSDFLIASSRKPLVGNSSELSIRGAQGEARRVFRRASARPPLSLFGVAAVSVEWSSEDVAYGSTVF